MKRSKQVSESISLGVVLALVGGFMDAYSYVCRDKVFANAQTGNMLLFGINLFEKNWPKVFRYLFPVVAFAVGIAIADLVRTLLLKKGWLHWRQAAVLCEAVVFASVGFLPQRINLLANCLTSLACGIQVESFRKIRGNGIATTMCIGNLRSATENISQFVYEKDKDALHRGFIYYGVIIVFVIGAVIGKVCVDKFAERAIWACVPLMLVAFAMMFEDRERAALEQKKLCEAECERKDPE